MSTLSPGHDIYGAPGLSVVRRAAPWVLLGLVVVFVMTMWGGYRSAAKQYAEAHSRSLATTGTAGPAAAKKEAATKASATKKAAAPAGPTLQVLVSGLNFRSSASTSSKVIRALPKGETLIVVQDAGKWFQVKDSKGTVGWVTSGSRYVKKTGS